MRNSDKHRSGTVNHQSDPLPAACAKPGKNSGAGQQLPDLTAGTLFRQRRRRRDTPLRRRQRRMRLGRLRPRWGRRRSSSSSGSNTPLRRNTPQSPVWSGQRKQRRMQQHRHYGWTGGGSNGGSSSLAQAHKAVGSCLCGEGAKRRCGVMACTEKLLRLRPRSLLRRVALHSGGSSRLCTHVLPSTCSSRKSLAVDTWMPTAGSHSTTCS